MNPSSRLTVEILPRRGRAPVPSLRSTRCLAEAEALMDRLAAEAGGDPAGFMVREHLSTGGKRLRARLALAALEALGEPRERGVAWAAACELLHNATLVHDDLQDGDAVRRGRPTVWALHGAAQAVNAGDLLLMLPCLALDHLPATDATRWALARALAGHACDVVRGQAAELELGAAERVEWSAWRAVAEGKTGALFALAVRGAALLAGRTDAEARSLSDAFRTLGLLFQLQDDVLDLYGEKGRGAPGSDLREGKTSALVVEHLELHPEDAAWLGLLLRAPRAETPDEEVERAILRFRTGGALDRVLGRINAAAGEALRAPGLAGEPALRALAAELVEVALSPIEPVRRPVVAIFDGEGRG
nr:polyprenyl synthase [uncultured bacterium]